MDAPPVLALTPCASPFGDGTTLHGRVTTFRAPVGTLHALAERALTPAGVEIRHALFELRDAPGCPEAGSPVVDGLALDALGASGELAGTPGGVVRDGAALALLVTVADVSGVMPSALGQAVTIWDGRRFTAVRFLTTADRPPFGAATVEPDDPRDRAVYAWGCLPARFLDADCWVARADRAALAGGGPATLEAWSGGGNWALDLDQATPVVAAGDGPGLFGGRRPLLVYATPLGHALTWRWGLGPAGPWSAPRPLGGCALPRARPDTFCGGVTAHPALSDAARVVLSHTVGTFEPGATPDQVQTRFVVAPRPAP